MAWKKIRLVPDNFDGTLLNSTSALSIKFNNTTSSGVPFDTGFEQVKSGLEINNLDNVVLATWTGHTSVEVVASSGDGWQPAAWNATEIAKNFGGTGRTSVTNGSILVGSTAADADMGEVAFGTTVGHLLKSNGSTLSYEQLDLANTSGVVAYNNGGGLSALTLSANCLVRALNSLAYEVRTPANFASDAGLSPKGHNHTSSNYLLKSADTMTVNLAMNKKLLVNVAMEVVANASIGTAPAYFGTIKVKKPASAGTLSEVYVNI